jgi:hypothetical protein
MHTKTLLIGLAATFYLISAPTMAKKQGETS